MNNPIPPEQQIRKNWNPPVIDPVAVAEAEADIAAGWDPNEMVGKDDNPPTILIASESGHTDPLTGDWLAEEPVRHYRLPTKPISLRRGENDGR